MHPDCCARPDATTTKADPALVLLPLPLAARTAACLVVGRTFFPYLATDNGEREKEREREREREADHVLVSSFSCGGSDCGSESSRDSGTEVK
jgi:hypothetical protein